MNNLNLFFNTTYMRHNKANQKGMAVIKYMNKAQDCLMSSAALDDFWDGLLSLVKELDETISRGKVEVRRDFRDDGFDGYNVTFTVKGSGYDNVIAYMQFKKVRRTNGILNIRIL